MEVISEGLRLRVHLARPPGEAGPAGQLLVLSHGFPAGPVGVTEAGQTYLQLANRLASEAGWTVLSFNFRGAGESEGSFSLSGWLSDLEAVVDHGLGVRGVAGVWLAGFSVGGALSICAAGEDQRVKGVASFAAPSDFGSWASDPLSLLSRARHVGVVKEGQPDNIEAWSKEFSELRPMALVGKIPPRALLIAHGSDDDVVDPAAARALAAESDGQAELRMLMGAGHRLRHDPRAVAMLLGWMERQRP